jgi:hypothetical protein
MPIDPTHNAQLGFAIFDTWLRAVEKSHHSHHGKCAAGISSPLVDAAFQAFNAYAHSVEAMNNAQIAALSPQLQLYSLNKSGTGAISSADLAPFLALNIMA